ncbi:Conserved oligomeric Golgi complex subunit 8 [Gracilariopsis chorda]|uniref:Conserved oligomeric Golgi complex subunit 8 n=1 Tax=Gracilariopsis chorda TaxID=448386 RepID=A0A2V3IZ81_9FLOR|nr:Conserved oligomeric Golgi complex subunit 8 [Gracilariopsis chorda]|eukprot:PXF47472.1 Conserved oligomeric Golgi complex subunit 8 [Gracilariopsis chorda]
MTAAVPADQEKPSDIDNKPTPLDPEADADEALKAICQFVLSDLPVDSPACEKWHGLNAYIEELCGYSIERLSREPDDLSSACIRLRNELEDVACGNYRALIESFECAGAVRDGVADVRSRLDSLIDSLPKLADATRRFSAGVTDKQLERESRLRAITEHRAVADIVEMPRLMTTLISAELYDEALELRECAVKLYAMHSDELLIRHVCEEMDVLTQQMVLQLLVLLRNPIQLPMCLRIVGFLRRLDVFAEYRLRMVFLHCRGEWMRIGMETSTASTRQAELVTLSDNMRSMMFEIITQYRAVFNDDFEGSFERNEDESTTRTGRSYSHSSAILSDWTSASVTEYLNKLSDGIKDVKDGAALNTILQQAMYCGQSLGRVGADFRAALPPIFEDAVVKIYCSHLNAALRQFEMMIEDNRWAPVGSSALRKERGQGGAGQQKSREAGSNQSGDLSTNQFDPPLAILDSPPLAVFLNGILAALNDLRLCAPISLGPRLGRVLQETLVNAGEFMAAIGGPGGAFLKRSDRPHYIAMASSLRNLCTPHATQCLEYCMNTSGMVDVDAIQDALTKIFGDTLPSGSSSNPDSGVEGGFETPADQTDRGSSPTQHQASPLPNSPEENGFINESGKSESESNLIL